LKDLEHARANNAEGVKQIHCFDLGEQKCGIVTFAVDGMAASEVKQLLQSKVGGNTMELSSVPCSFAPSRPFPSSSEIMLFFSPST
jgi:hypothetical protein